MFLFCLNENSFLFYSVDQLQSVDCHDNLNKEQLHLHVNDKKISILCKKKKKKTINSNFFLYEIFLYLIIDYHPFICLLENKILKKTKSTN